MLNLSEEERREVLKSGGHLAFSCRHPKLGDFIVYFRSDNCIVDDLYVVEAEPGAIFDGKVVPKDPNKEFCDYQGVMTLSFDLMVPLAPMELVHYFHDYEKENYCFTFKNEKENLQSYHVQKQDGKWGRIEAKTSSTAQSFQFLKDIDIPGYWMWEGTHSSGIQEFQVYSYKEGRFVSNYFHEIDFDVEDTGYFAYVRRDLFDYDMDDNGQEEAVYLGTLFGYVDENFLFATPLYDTKKKQLVTTTSFTKLSHFEDYAKQATDAYYLEFLSEQAGQEEALIYMQSHPNPKCRPQGQIISFREKVLEKRK